jgi:hypothetical protein
VLRHAFQTSTGALPLVLVAALAVGCSGAIPGNQTPAPGSSRGPAATNRPEPSMTSVASTAPSASEAEPSSGVLVLGAGGSGAIGPGTYVTAFQPRVTFTLVDRTILAANGTIAYESIGEADANLPGWVDISFGFDKPERHGHGTWSGDFGIGRIDQVFDPAHPASAIDPPKDLARWIEKLPGLRLTAPPRAVEVGGLDATQLDVMTGDTGVSFGPIPDVADPPGFGFGPNQPARIIVVTVDGHELLITLGGADGSAHFARVVAALQPLVDSIAWG